MNLPDKLLSIVLSGAFCGLPIADRISPTVRINRRAVRRLGCCIREGDGYHIEAFGSHALRIGNRLPCGACTRVTAYLPGCMNHGNRWKRYATQMRRLSAMKLSAQPIRQNAARAVPGNLCRLRGIPLPCIRSDPPSGTLSLPVRRNVLLRRKKQMETAR